MRINHVNMTTEELDTWHLAQQGKSNFIRGTLEFLEMLSTKVVLILMFRNK